LIGRAGILELLIPFFDVDNNDLQASALRVIANSAAEEGCYYYFFLFSKQF